MPYCLFLFTKCTHPTVHHKILQSPPHLQFFAFTVQLFSETLFMSFTIPYFNFDLDGFFLFHNSFIVLLRKTCIKYLGGEGRSRDSGELRVCL